MYEITKDRIKARIEKTIKNSLEQLLEDDLKTIKLFFGEEALPNYRSQFNEALYEYFATIVKTEKPSQTDIKSPNYATQEKAIKKRLPVEFIG